jgi:hypothetical protein
VSGKRMAKGIPGKPPPVPISKISEPFELVELRV